MLIALGMPRGRVIALFTLEGRSFRSWRPRSGRSTACPS